MENSGLLEYYKKRVKPHKSTLNEFMNKVFSVSKELDIDPLWLLATMDSESGLDSTKQNTGHPVNNGYATGLIQFIPSTAGRVLHGKSYDAKADAKNGFKIGREATDKLKVMSSVEQMDYVKKYFDPYVSRLNSYVDLYMTTFFPLALGMSDSFVLETKNIPAGKLASANPIFDSNKDHKVTVGEIKLAFMDRVPSEFREEFKKGMGIVSEMVTETKRFAKRNWIPISLTVVSLIGLTWVVIKYNSKTTISI